MSRKITTLVLAALIAATSITASYAEQAKEEPQKIARCADATYDRSGSTREATGSDVKKQQVQDRSQEGSTLRHSSDGTPRPELGPVQ